LLLSFLCRRRRRRPVHLPPSKSCSPAFTSAATIEGRRVTPQIIIGSPAGRGINNNLEGALLPSMEEEASAAAVSLNERRTALQSLTGNQSLSFLPAGGSQCSCRLARAALQHSHQQPPQREEEHFLNYY
jgi:hypothetical protein